LDQNLLILMITLPSYIKTQQEKSEFVWE